MSEIFVGVIMASALLGIAGGCTTPGDRSVPVSDSKYSSVYGEAVDPLRCLGGRLSALVFITVDCPIANGYAPQLKAMFQSFEDEPVDFFLVHVDPEVDAVRARAHAEEYGYEGRNILLDPRHSLVKRCEATITPEAVLLSEGGVVHYRGRINNWYGDIGRKRFQPSRHELRDAILQVLAGEPVKVPRAPAVGCDIEDLVDLEGGVPR